MKSIQKVVVNKWKNQKFHSMEDTLVQEESILIHINYKPFTLTMRSPGDELELVNGLLFTEKIIDKEAIQMDITEKKKGIITSVNVNINPETLENKVFDKRNLLSVSSCGVCGKLELNEKCSSDDPIYPQHKISTAFLSDSFEKMKGMQIVFEKTGSCHAAAILDDQNNIISVKEDIGRHNAVDKVIGDVLIHNKDTEMKVLLVSGRVSYEIVTKAFIAGIEVIAAVSGASALAVELCEDAGITLIGFCRNDQFTCYTHSERLITP